MLLQKQKHLRIHHRIHVLTHNHHHIRTRIWDDDGGDVFHDLYHDDDDGVLNELPLIL